MSGFEKFTTEVANVAEYIGTKTSEFVDKTKIKMMISSEETIINNLYRNIGREYYDKFRAGTEMDVDFTEICRSIELHEKTIESLKTQGTR